MYLYWVLLLLSISIQAIYGYEQHCIDPANCQYYPVHSCYATDIGLVCKNRNHGGFEMSIDPIYTFIYTPFNIKNDTGLPCETIPITDELINYVDYRGQEVINVEDLDLTGNCSSMSYCDKKTRTCQPKLPLGSRCQYNMQCYFGIDGIPGHCNTNHTCSIRQDIPQYYYNAPRWTMGDQWKSAVIAVLITGGIAVIAIIGRYQIKKWTTTFKDWMEKWQNSDTSNREQLLVENEQVWNQQHSNKKWWKQVPGINWFFNKYSKKKNANSSEQYYQLNDIQEEEGIIVDEPPPYHAPSSSSSH